MNCKTARSAKRLKKNSKLISLIGRPCTQCADFAQTDGTIHTDSETKIITVLLYLNDNWSADGGRLRILRNGTDLDDYVAEVPPSNGTLLVFRRSDNSWHGHKPFEGQRRVVQMNWVLDEDVVNREQRRHSVSTRFKKLKISSPAARHKFGSSF